MKPELRDDRPDPPPSERNRILQVYASRRQGDYSFFEPWFLQLCQQRERLLAVELRRLGVRSLADRRILEVGCGRGHWLRLFNYWGARPEDLRGCDINADRLGEARALHPAIACDLTMGRELPYQAGSFDLVLQSTVFSSILDLGMQRELAGEMLRVLKDHGIIIWYDFRWNNPRNPDVRGLGATAIRGLFPGCRVRLVSVGLLPPLARRVARWSSTLSALLERIPPLRYAYLGLIRKEA